MAGIASQDVPSCPPVVAHPAITVTCHSARKPSECCFRLHACVPRAALCWQVNVRQLWLTLSSITLAFVFVFGNSIRNL